MCNMKFLKALLVRKKVGTFFQNTERWVEERIKPSICYVCEGIEVIIKLEYLETQQVQQTKNCL